MLEIFGESYFIDFEAINNVINLKESQTVSGETEQTINFVSFEVIKIMIEVIMSEREDIDNNLGVMTAKNLSIPFRIAFNTLLTHGIIKSL
jgi:hypothetical protein